MRFTIFVLPLFLSLTQISVASEVRTVNCPSNEQGVSLKIVSKPEIETVQSWFQVTFFHAGVAHKSFEAFETSERGASILELSGTDPDLANFDQYFAIDPAAKTVSYAMVANNGLSPLPGATFSHCVIR